MKMATIGTAIRLNDMMSAPIRHITNAMNMMLSSWNNLDNATSGGLDVGNVEAIPSELNQATRAADQLGKEQEEFNRKVSEGNGAMDGLTNKILGAVGAFVGLQSIGKLVNLSDSFTQTQARLSMIVDKGSDVEELFDKITASANRSRASISATADMVAKLSLNADDAFDSNDETILFAENLNKLFAIAGTNQQGIASATLQLTQALGSGVLRGEEFNAVFEAAPNIMQQVAEYMDVPIGKLRSMAQEGKITAEVVKNALLSRTKEIDDRFSNMPMTWAQVWTQAMNGLYRASMPLLNAINWLANNISIITPLVIGLGLAFAIFQVAAHWTQICTVATTIYQAAVRFLSIGFGILTGNTAAASAAMFTYNSALMASPITWWLAVIILIIAAFYALIAVINKVTGSTLSATGMIVGALTTAVAFIWNLFLALVDFVLGCINALVNPWIRFANFFGNLFNDPIGAIIHLFGDLADSVLGILETIAKAIDKIFGSNLASTVQGWRSSVSGWVDNVANEYGNGTYEQVADNLNLSSESLGLSRWAYTDAYNTGYSWGEGIEDSVGGMFGGGLGDEFSMDNLTESVGNVPAFDEIAGNTSDIKNGLDITNENLKYLRDLAEQDAINRFTTAEIRVEMTNNNSISSEMDLDGVIDYMVTGVQEAIERSAEGVHI